MNIIIERLKFDKGVHETNNKTLVKQIKAQENTIKKNDERTCDLKMMKERSNDVQASNEENRKQLLKQVS
jgi:hypothetical protein